MDISEKQFFQSHHFAAFDPPKPDLDDDETRAERLRVRDSLLELGEELWPFISTQGWDLHRHRQKTHYTSSFHFITQNGQPIVNNIGSMWLHYGKSSEQLDSLKTLGGFDFHQKDYDDFFNAFYLHTRLQIYINSSVVRFWLLFTDKNYYDRSEFLKKIRRNPDQAEKFWQMTTKIKNKGYFYEIDGNRFEIDQCTKDSLIKFVKSDHSGVYSGFVKEYQPDDTRISKSIIISEMKQNFIDLYPLYDFMAYRIGSKNSSNNLELLKNVFPRM
jgi:hypothetical protein